MSSIRECKTHGKTKFTTTRSKEGWPKHACNKCTNDANTARRIERKKFLLNMLGGKCSSCGYSKSIAALHFHHKEASSKMFPLSTRFLGKKIPALIEEAKKCEILCANCHYEHHYMAEEIL